jgi:hypothetical protein
LNQVTDGGPAFNEGWRIDDEELHTPMMMTMIGRLNASHAFRRLDQWDKIR